MDKNEILSKMAHNQADSVRPFVREWAEAIRANPDKVILEKAETLEECQWTKQTFAPAGLDKALAVLLDFMDRNPLSKRPAIVSEHKDDDGNRVVVDLKDDEKALLEHAFFYVLPEQVEHRKWKQQRDKHMKEAIRLAQLPAFTS